ncbi:MAG: hypothetical protein QOE02_2113, partial [Rhodospirillaceae bacterium]|nr:hypothetical protein [Rhodospirillaceae bacterium]
MKLEGLKVVDLSWFLPGPYLTTALADHGAEVIKIEPPVVRCCLTSGCVPSVKALPTTLAHEAISASCME